MIKIRLTKKRSALADDEDGPLLSEYNWWALESSPGRFYAYGRLKGTSSRRVLMHRLILAAPGGVEVDHLNGEGLDNRRTNLRACSHQENLRNRQNPYRARMAPNRMSKPSRPDKYGMIHIAVTVTPKLVQTLKIAAASSGQSMSGFVRSLIENKITPENA